LLEEEEKENEFIHSRYQKRYYKALSIAQRRLRYNRVPRIALLPPAQSAWRKIYSSRNDQAMITLTGFDLDTFEWLNSKFEPYFNTHSPFIKDKTHIVPIPCPGKGRKRLINSRDCLALNLAWTRTRGNTTVLEIIFGMTGTPVDRYLIFGRRILLEVLSNEPDAAVKIPSEVNIDQYKRSIAMRHPLLTDVWCAMDGLKLLLECSGDTEVENDFYNGWTCDHYASGVFVFCPDGTIPICAFNVPGSVHDSKIAAIGGVYKKLGDVFRRNGGKCCVDSAFAKQLYEYLIKSGKKDILDDPHEREVKTQATSLRQTSEWGMHGFQSSFPRVKDRFIFETNGERKRIVQLMIYLYNLRSRRVSVRYVDDCHTLFDARQEHDPKPWIQLG
jgi:hypothetical protein